MGGSSQGPKESHEGPYAPVPARPEEEPGKGWGDRPEVGAPLPCEMKGECAGFSFHARFLAGFIIFVPNDVAVQAGEHSSRDTAAGTPGLQVARPGPNGAVMQLDRWNRHSGKDVLRG